MLPRIFGVWQSPRTRRQRTLDTSWHLTGKERRDFCEFANRRVKGVRPRLYKPEVHINH